MPRKSFEFNAEDGAPIHGHCWLPDTAPRAVAIVIHGMAEHSGRYHELGAALAASGMATFAPDLRGHGPRSGRRRGDFGDAVWQRLLADLDAVRAHALDRFQARPVVLFGHSMGSFVVQELLATRDAPVAAVVLSATDKPPLPLRLAGSAVAALERRRLGPRATSDLLRKMSFGAFNRPFSPARTAFDWLSADSAAVDAYIDDPDCGFDCTVASWQALLQAIGRAQSRTARRKLPRALPVLMVAGDADPVARNGRGPRVLARAYRRAGLRDVTVRVYPRGRHELLHDAMAAQVRCDMLDWLDARLPGAGNR